MGGDYFDYVPMADGRIFVVVADVSGTVHGGVDLNGAFQPSAIAARQGLGAALETPMTRLLETASEAPRAAAEERADVRRDAGRGRGAFQVSIRGDLVVSRVMGDIYVSAVSGFDLQW